MQHTAAPENVELNRGNSPHARRRPALPALLLALVFAVLLAHGGARAQDTSGGDDSSQPQSDTLKRLKELQAEAEAREAIAKAKRAELDARFPQSSGKTLEGKTTVGDGERIEERLVGFISVGDAADRIAAAIHRAHPEIKSIAVYNDGDVQLLLIYSAATKRVDAYAARFNNLATAEQAALTAYPMWSVPNAPCDAKALAAGRGGAGFVNPLGAATSLLGSVNDILAFFRTDVEIKSSTFDVAEPVVVTEVFRALRGQYGERQIALYYPREFPPDFDPRQDSPMLNKLEALFNSKANAEALAAQINQRIADKNEQIKTLQACQALAGQASQKAAQDQQKVIADLEGKLAALPAGRAGAQQRAALEARLAEERRKAAAIESGNTPADAAKKQHGDDIKKLQTEVAALQSAAQPLAALDQQADLLVKDMIKVDDKTGLNPLTAFIRSERIQKLMDDTNGYWLKLNVVKAGGNTRVKTNLLIDVFNGGNRVRYSGASIVEYHLYDRLGRSVLSDTTNSYVDYMKPKDVLKRAAQAQQTSDQK